MSDIVTYIFAGMNVLLIAGLLLSQFMSRKDLRDTADGVSDFMKSVQEESWKQNQFEIQRLRGELEKAQLKVLRLNPVAPATHHQAPAVNAPRATSRNGKRPDLEHAIQGGL